MKTGLPTSDQRGAADPACSAWVTASAGTGKTHVLADRVVRLLLTGTPPGRILCLTFTRAAAAEMSNRIAERLARWSRTAPGELAVELEDLTGEPTAVERVALAPRLFARVLDAPGGLKILTIHAFCQSLLARFPLEAGVAPHFSVLDERSAAEFMHAGHAALVAGGGRDAAVEEAIAAVAVGLNEGSFSQVIAEVARERHRLLHLLRGPSDAAAVQRDLAQHFRLSSPADEATICAAACRDGAFDALGLRRVWEALRTGSPTQRESAEAIARWLGDPAGREARFGDYRRVFLTQHGEARKAVLPKTADEAARGIVAREQERLVAVEQALRASRVVARTTALLRVAAVELAAYDAAKRYSARLDYDDLILKARALLLEAGAAAWVLYKLDGGIDHILIDEAQDTSREQWDVVAALAEEFFVGQGACQAGRTIFAVGDPKQSIFSFQRADPAAFARFGAHFGARAAPGAWRRVALTTSFRSVPAVLRVVDRVFANPAAREGLLQGDDPIGHRSHRRGQAGLVELWAPEAAAEVPQPGEWRLPLEREEQESAAVRLARRIARTIRGWLDGKEILDSRARPIQHGDIMILVQRRTTTFFEEMVRALKQADISVAGVDRMVLTDHLAVMDLIALGHFLLLPDDDLTLATLLRSPLVGFSEELLAELALGRTASLWRTLQRRAAEHPDFAAASAALGGLLAGTDYHPPFELFAQVLSAGGGRERLLGRIGAEAAEPVEEFLARALEYEREHAPSLQGFLHWLETGRAEVRRDLEHGRDEVRLLTVHGAKGLEAPIVFLPDTCRFPRLEDKLLWPEGTDLVLWPPRKDACDGQSLLVRETAEQRLRSEYRRLLYVALTRAEERLYVCGWNTLQARAPGCWYDLIAPAVRELGSEVAGADGAPFWRVAEPRRSAPDHPSGPARETPETRPPAWLGATAPVTPADARLTPSRPAGVEPVVRSPLGRAAPAWRRGVLIHRLLQTLPAMAAGQREAAAAAYLAQPGHGLRPAEQDEIRRVTLGVLATPDFAPLFGPGSRAEVPLAGRVAGRVIVGQVDRLAVSGEEVLVIDYKTHRPPPRSVDEVPTIYLQQMAAYQALLGAIHAGRTVRCALLWTEGPLLMPLSADALAPHQP